MKVWRMLLSCIAIIAVDLRASGPQRRENGGAIRASDR